MFVIIFSSFYVLNENVVCSLTIKTISVCNIRKEIYSYLKKNKICGFPLITNYIDKKDLLIYQDKFNDMYANLQNNLDKKMHIKKYNKVINITLSKPMYKEECGDLQLIKLFMNKIVINVSSLLSENINHNLGKLSHYKHCNLYKLQDDYKNIRLVDKYINNFITARSDLSFTYRLYKVNEEKYHKLSNVDFVNLMNIY